VLTNKFKIVPTTVIPKKREKNSRTITGGGTKKDDESLQNDGYKLVYTYQQRS
jgi:hypothetical protein